MRVSEITGSRLAEYLRLDYDALSVKEKDGIETMREAAMAFIRSYTGLDDDGIEPHEDFVIVVYILVQDMYDNRVLYVERDNLNKTVETILGMHSVNLL
ncbi:MAG: head-tail connector protein [Clostridiales bacterium]|nr:head-tail connector protein [Clostridiales bacterium]